MKDMRMLGLMIRKCSDEANMTESDLCEIFGCNENNVHRLLAGQMLPSYQQLQEFAKRSGTTVSRILDGDEAYYDKHVITHCFGEFTNKEARENILDIMEDVLLLEELVRA